MSAPPPSVSVLPKVIIAGAGINAGLAIAMGVWEPSPRVVAGLTLFFASAALMESIRVR